MIKCLIIDDEPLAGQLLEVYTQRSPDLEHLATFSDPIEALHFLNEHKVDLLFLDIQMPELTGIQLMKITKGQYDIILTTAYKEYALEGYEFDVVDYLLKPISLDRFFLAVEKVKKRRSTPLAPSHEPRDKNAPVNSPDYLFIKSGHKTVRIDLADVYRLESLDNYVAIYTQEEKILTLENMSHFAEHLPAGNFIRVHRSHIVALDKIDFIERNRIVIQGNYIPISNSYRDAFWERVQGKGK